MCLDADFLIIKCLSSYSTVSKYVHTVETIFFLVTMFYNDIVADIVNSPCVSNRSFFLFFAVLFSAFIFICTECAIYYSSLIILSVY